MTAITLVLCLGLVAQAPAPGPGTPAKGATPSQRARAQREATIAKRKAARATRRAQAAKQEAELREYDLKMAPIVANQEIEMARIHAQQQQNAMTQQALMNLQAIEAARLANERYAIQSRYWESQQPIRVIVGPRQP